MKNLKEIIKEQQKQRKKVRSNYNEKDLISYNHKANITRTYHVFGAHVVNKNDFPLYNFVSMDRRNYHFDNEDKLFATCEHLIENKHILCSLVPRIGVNTIFFCDVDFLGDEETIENVLEHMNTILSKKYDEQFLKQIWVTKSKSFHKYHVYVPGIILEKNELDTIWNDINDECKAKGMKGKYHQKTNSWKLPIDTSCTFGLRLDGFEKYNKQTNRYERNTSYEPYFKSSQGWQFLDEDFFLDKNFFCETNLLIDELVDVTRTKNQKRSIYANQSNTNNASSLSQSEPSSTKVNSSNSNTNNSTIQSLDNSFNDSIVTMESINTSSQFSDLEEEINNISFYGKQALDYLNQNFNFFMHKLVGHNIKRIDITNKDTTNETIFIHCGKNQRDRTCPLRNRVHRSNNIYYIWFANKQELHVRCHNPECSKRRKSSIIVYKTVSSREIASQLTDNGDDDEMAMDRDDLVVNDYDDDDDDEDDLWTDIDIGELYFKLNPDILYSTQFKFKPKDDGTFFHYNTKYGLWIADRGAHTLKRNLSTKFKKQIKIKWNQKIANETDQYKRKILISQKKLLRKKLGDWGNVKNVLETLKTLCIKEEVELDSNPMYFIANDVVFDLETQTVVIPKKEEYITNTRKASWDFQKFDQEMDTYIHDKLFKKLFPDENQRETICVYLSTILNGKTLKKFCVNLGMYLCTISKLKICNFQISKCSNT